MVSLQDLNEGMSGCKSIPLVCPICRGELVLENYHRRLGRVRTGDLRCLRGCAVYPIIYGVPVILPPGRPAVWGPYMPAWRTFLRRHGKQKLMEALDAGKFKNDPEVSGPPVTKEMLNKAKHTMSKAGWQQHLKSVKTSSKDPDAVAIAERLQPIESGVIVDIGPGGGYTTERVLQETQPSVGCVAVDIDFDCVKITGKRVELLGMSDRCIEICADARQLPFADESLAAAYSRYGFLHVRGYVAALREAYRVLAAGGHLIATEKKSGRSLHPDTIGLFYEEQFEILRRLGLIAHGQEFIKNVEQSGFDVLGIFDGSQKLRTSRHFLIDAIRG